VSQPTNRRGNDALARPYSRGTLADYKTSVPCGLVAKSADRECLRHIADDRHTFGIGVFTFPGTLRPFCLPKHDCTARLTAQPATQFVDTGGSRSHQSDLSTQMAGVLARAICRTKCLEFSPERCWRCSLPDQPNAMGCRASARLRRSCSSHSRRGPAVLHSHRRRVTHNCSAAPVGTEVIPGPDAGGASIEARALPLTPGSAAVRPSPRSFGALLPPARCRAGGAARGRPSSRRRSGPAPGRSRVAGWRRPS
jgi:hypothetical protein